MFLLCSIKEIDILTRKKERDSKRRFNDPFLIESNLYVVFDGYFQTDHLFRGNEIKAFSI